MGGLLEHFRAADVTFEARADGTLRAIGTLTDVARATIREHKVAILAELAANDAAPVLPGGSVATGQRVERAGCDTRAGGRTS